ncbi:MAG TPA: cell wall hydrolase [Gammaproteobacteria bacterium]|nr:cell wall hydrolase [Gammaproteobacteria bacterium]
MTKITSFGLAPAIRAASLAGLALLFQFDSDAAETGWFKEQQHCMALNMYWEARGEGTDGMIAVGWTVLNRMRSRRFPSTPCDVVYQGGQRRGCEFSWWCDGRSDRPRDARSWRLAQHLAERVLVSPPPDPTGGAIYYHATSVRPGWPHALTTRIGQHLFYR